MTFRLERSHLFAVPRSDRALIAHNAGIADQEAHDTHEKMTQPTVLTTSTGKKSKNSLAHARQMFAKPKDADQCHDQSNGEPDNNRSAPSQGSPSSSPSDDSEAVQDERMVREDTATDSANAKEIIISASVLISTMHQY